MKADEIREALFAFNAMCEEFGRRVGALTVGLNAMNKAADAFVEAIEKLILENPGLLEELQEDAAKECPKCYQRDVGQTGEAPCEECGLPTRWNVGDLTKEQLALIREMKTKEVAALEKKSPRERAGHFREGPVEKVKGDDAADQAVSLGLPDPRRPQTAPKVKPAKPWSKPGPGFVLCPDCNGDGGHETEAGDPKTCGTCRGHGVVNPEKGEEDETSRKG